MSGLLGSIYSYGNTLQRKLKGLLADPAGTIGLGVTRMGEDQQQLVNLAQDAGYMPGSRSVLVSPEQKALARALLSQKATEMGGGMLGTFIGPGAKTWDALANSKAVKMEAAGVDPRAIWKDTMNWRGPDGKWRQEIDDSASKFVADKGFRLGDYLPHSKLYKAYPDMKKQWADIRPSPDGVPSGIYKHSSNNPVGVQYTTPENARSIALHEIQHAIQQREGFAAGGSSDMAFRDPRMWGKDGAAGSDIARQMLKAKMQEMATPQSIEQYAKNAWGSDVVTPEIQAAYKDYVKSTKASAGQYANEAQKTVAKEWYRRLAGEAEARATQARMNLDAAQRRGLFPADSYDVPLDSLIVRYGNEPTNALVQALRGR